MGNTHIHVRIDADIKKQAQIIFSEMGLDITSAINMFIRQVIRTRTFPFLPSADFSQAEQEQTMPDEDVMAISSRIMKKNREAYEVLAK